MASASCCILLVYGIPGSGKSMLTDYLCSESGEGAMVPIHFDHFYPPDTRARPISKQAEEDSTTEWASFGMKQTRLQVVECIEHLIRQQLLSSRQTNPLPPLPPPPPPPLWSEFTSYLQSYRHLFQCHGNTAAAADNTCSSNWCLKLPGVLVVDDNLPLRSMRYTFYQMARKYQLGFAEACVCCDAKLARSRNDKRNIPIPNSTIADMEQSLELPESSKYQWEKRSAVLFNNGSREEFLTLALGTVRELILGALASPEQQLTPENIETKEQSRIESLESYLHQADIILRRCVSLSMKEYKGPEKGGFAKLANTARRLGLEEVRTGGLVEQCRVDRLSAASDEYESKLQKLFQSKLYSQQ